MYFYASVYIIGSGRFFSQRWCLLLLRENRCLTTSEEVSDDAACYWMEERRWYLLEIRQYLPRVLLFLRLFSAEPL